MKTEKYDFDGVRAKIKAMEEKIRENISNPANDGGSLNSREVRIFDTAFNSTHSRDFEHLIEETNSRTIQDYLIIKNSYFKAKGL